MQVLREQVSQTSTFPTCMSFSTKVDISMVPQMLESAGELLTVLGTVANKVKVCGEFVSAYQQSQVVEGRELVNALAAKHEDTVFHPVGEFGFELVRVKGP